MDRFYVIDRIDNLTDLENDMFEWSRLPMKFKYMSDDACIKQHGMKNIQYYELIKSKLLGDTVSTKYTDDTLKEEYAPQYTLIDREIADREGHQERLRASKELQQSPYIVIIDLEDYTDKNTDVLTYKYDKYRKLPVKYRRWSDYYSNDIYGATVTDMYNMLIAMYTYDHRNQVDHSVIVKDPVTEVTQKYLDRAICECNAIDVLTYKLANSIGIDESYRDRWVGDDLVFDDSLDFDSVFNKITPFFTPDEYNKLSENQLVESLDYNEWKKALREAVKEDDKQKIIDLGWNPSVPFNEKTQEFARDRQISWFKEKSPKLIDITRLEDQLIFEPIEESKSMDSLYSLKGVYPVYIVMSCSDTLFGNMEKFIKKVEFTHVGLAFDSNLSEIFTFSFGKDWNGFVVDTVDTYIDNSKKSTMSVLTIFVDKEVRDTMYRNLNYIQDNRKRTKYGFGNILNILINRGKKFPYPENMSLVCSQFVDMMLKMVNIDITGKTSNLVIPEDFKNAYNQRAYVYKVYEGLCTKYNASKVDSIIRKLLVGSVENIKINTRDDDDSTDMPVRSFFKQSLVGEHNDILDSLRYILTPQKILESNFRFNDKGELEVNLYTDLENQYEESHKLLTSYEVDNIEGLKREVAHMFSINNSIEKVIRNKKSKDEEYDLLIALRVKVIEDFKLYLKEIKNIEKDFDFQDYYQKSEYNMNVKELDNITFKYSGDDIKKAVNAVMKFKG